MIQARHSVSYPFEIPSMAKTASTMLQLGTLAQEVQGLSTAID